MATNSNAVQSVTPVASQSVNGEKMVETKVTVIEGKEQALIAHNATVTYFELAFGLQDNYENQSAYTKDSMVDAARMFLRAECARAIAKWDNIVTAASKTQRYKNIGREQVDKQLRENPKCKGFYQSAKKAAEIKSQL